jgi:hypothetical protein
VENPSGKNADPSRAPRGGLRLMILIFVALVLVAMYANVQKARREKIETVTIIPATVATPTRPQR